MTDISVLTREIAAEYRSITKRPISVEEYLLMRERALIESDRGYAVESSVIPEYTETSIPAPETRPVIVQKPVSKAVPEPKISIPAPIIPVQNIKTSEPTNNASENPFFALCNSLD